MANCHILQSCNVHTLILDTTYCNPQVRFLSVLPFFLLFENISKQARQTHHPNTFSVWLSKTRFYNPIRYWGYPSWSFQPKYVISDWYLHNRYVKHFTHLFPISTNMLTSAIFSFASYKHRKRKTLLWSSSNSQEKSFCWICS